jgi:hypothetical protein
MPYPALSCGGGGVRPAGCKRTIRAERKQFVSHSVGEGYCDDELVGGVGTFRSSAEGEADWRWIV